MKGFGRIVLLAAVIVGSVSISAAERRSTRADAEALVNQGIELFASKGPEEGIRVINKRGKPFMDRDLYLFVIGPDGTIVAHAFDESRVGIPAEELYDEDGQPYGKLMMKLANDKGVWIPYRQFNPVSRKVEAKQSIVRKSNGYIFGCGVYGE